MSDLPKLTLLITAWDGYVAFLAQMLESLAGQLSPEMELLVVDNASEVPLPELPAGARVLRTPARLGVGAARNFGLAEVQTPFVVLIDADDIFPPGYFQLILERFERSPRLVAVAIRPILWDPASGRMKPSFFPSERAFLLARHRRLFGLSALLQGPLLIMSGTGFRTEAVRRAGGHDDFPYRSDANLGFILPFLGEVEVHAGPGRLYRIHPDSLVNRRYDRETIARSYELLRERLARHPDVPRYVKALLPLVRRRHEREVTRRFREQEAGRANLSLRHLE